MAKNEKEIELRVMTMILNSWRMTQMSLKQMRLQQRQRRGIYGSDKQRFVNFDCG
jgi:hypothetical protein